ncbi:glutathione S-transferase family protein [Lampropedia aestuarii]|uniref:Glutathione S-transferase family protein n=1 Tax=Lampropedia aestuarii TaxID=2562762 RepID=A0A4S5BUU2_9BURK|nr:glutathione binding-like protein [Lampropedia aestuarii]THJ36470.1 glutathione S-transferase family protein [Lampropedia aestuarii]
MLDLYTWGTPNGHKVHIMLEECDAQYRIHPVNISNQESIDSQIASLTINKKIPLLVDNNAASNQGPLVIAESGAILIYLAEKYQQFWATEPTARYQTMQWLMFQMSAVGPMMGQCNHFKSRHQSDGGYALARFSAEVARIHAVMEQHVRDHAYFAGSHYSIADMAIFPWLRLSQKLDEAWSARTQLHRWYERIALRPAVQRALHLPDLNSKAAT